MDQKRVLIVDDDASGRAALADIYRDEGYDVRIAASFAEALGVLFEFSPHLVITDLMMPGNRNGLDLLKALRDMDNVQVIAMTAYDYAHRSAMDLGAHACLPKPLDVDALLSTTESLLVA